MSARPQPGKQALRLLVALAVCWCASVQAQEAMVRARLANAAEVWVGQQVTLVVELLAPGYFSSAASFDVPDPEGVLLMPPAGHPMVSNETFDGTLYTVQRHELTAWPMRAGAETLPAVTVRFRFKRNPLDQDDVAAAVTTEPLALQVALPPGAEGLGTVISARHLTLEESWQPEPATEDIRAGAAFKRTVTFTAPDVPGMVFPPFPAVTVDGLGVYANRRLLDTEDRGALTGVRRDEITYVCQRPGRFVIPAARFTWFDLDSRELRTEDLPARTLTVVTNPALAAAAAGPLTRFGLLTWIGGLLGALALLLSIWLAARSPAIRRLVSDSVAVFRPVHLEPLNPAPHVARQR